MTDDIDALERRWRQRESLWPITATERQDARDGLALLTRLRAAENVWTELSVIASCSSHDGHAELDQVRDTYERLRAAEQERDSRVPRAELQRQRTLADVVLQRAEQAEARVSQLEAHVAPVLTDSLPPVHEDHKTEHRLKEGGKK